MNRRNRRYSGQKKPLSTPSIGAAVCGAVSLTIWFLAIAFSAKAEGGSGNVAGGICVLAMILSIGAFAAGFGMVKNENFEKISRIVGVAVPGAAMLCWILLYCIGILVG